MSAAIDDLGVEVALGPTVERVVSLVPSLTEAVAATRADALVGATDWCTHPADLEAARIRGTKNPDITAIIELGPDLVIANKEENREPDVRRLRENGVAVWVTDIETVPHAVESMRRLFEIALGWGVPEWLEQVTVEWSGPAPEPHADVLVPIWRDPWMVVGPDTFTSDLLGHLGYRNVAERGDDRYPKMSATEIDDAEADLIMLPDEPYEFSVVDGPEAFTVTPTRLVEGRLLTWYGPSLLDVRAALG